MNAISDFMSPAPHRIRVLTGPLQGTNHIVHGRLRLGRGDMADVQLLDPRVSREHAEIVADHNGQHWLADLGSSNGTSYRHQSVQRELLRPNTVFRIEGHSFLFEPMPTMVGNYQTFVRGHQSASRCETIEYDTQWLCSLARPLGNMETPPADDEYEGRCLAVARYPDRSAYDGNPIEDIAEYRRLERALIRNQLRAPSDFERLEQLTGRLCTPTARRARFDRPRLYARLSCEFPSSLRLLSGRSIPVTTLELGIDGARVLGPADRLSEGETLWLTLDLITGPCTRTIAFTCVVEWTDATHIGLSFALQRHPPAIEPTLQRFNPHEITRPIPGGSAERGMGAACPRTSS